MNLVRTGILYIYASILVVVGLALLYGGAHLLKIGGSPYYGLCGLAVLISGILLWRRRAEGAALYGWMLLATLAWAIWETGFDAWTLMPRLLAPVVLGLVLLIPALRSLLVRRSPPWPAIRTIGATISAVMIGAVLHASFPVTTAPDPLYQTGMSVAPAPTPIPVPENPSGDWLNYGNDPGGSRFSPLTQITPANVSKLQLAWTYQINAKPSRVETTPLKIGDTLYLCTGKNDIIAVDAETGKQRWRFDAHPDGSRERNEICRGVGYYKRPGASGACAERIITNTSDARLIALDAHDGTPCADFGTNGQVSLWTGMGPVERGYYFVSSAPTIIHGKIVLGGWVMDNQYWGEPSGVIRAFDTVTGKLAWAWDMGQPERVGEPPEGETYTRSTPNSWSPMSADETLGLVYVPMGNPPPDYYGALRRPFDEKYGSSVVALDADTGRPRWSFQTVHHDLWDYDIASQPTLVDIPTAEGTVPALVQPTKRGEIFVLNRATGAPIRPVEEHPVPQNGAVPEEHLSSTQPFSVGMPSFRNKPLTESDMWGITPLDQLWCRTKFREARYEGIFTPPGLTPTVQLPGSVGSMNYGGTSIDKSRNIAIINSSTLPNYTHLIDRSASDKLKIKRFSAETDKTGSGLASGPGQAQEGTPYAIVYGPFMSPLGVPCNRPPYGRLSAVDLVTGKLIWTQPIGTARDIGPLGLRSKIPFTIGTFFGGGSVVTQSGLIFIGGTQDRSFRAFETTSGKLLWETDLPTGAIATPMTYMTSANGRQFVIVVASGIDNAHRGDGDYLLAYALPESPAK